MRSARLSVLHTTNKTNWVLSGGADPSGSRSETEICTMPRPAACLRDTEVTFAYMYGPKLPQLATYNVFLPLFFCLCCRQVPSQYRSVRKPFDCAMSSRERSCRRSQQLEKCKGQNMYSGGTRVRPLRQGAMGMSKENKSGCLECPGI